MPCLHDYLGSLCSCWRRLACLRWSLIKSILLCKCMKIYLFFGHQKLTENTHFLFTVATSATWTSFTVGKNEPHSPPTSTLLGTISVKISNYDVLIYRNAVLQTFKQMILHFVETPDCLYLVISYRWYFSYWLFNAKPDRSVPFSLSYVHTSSSPLVWEV